ncbi:IQ and ubiquitin-like domain-containing protein [Acrasis kona]|uniref:IQ and ubiquitin-like domain-containing protein n=1 Tax=Acrasis kona TaxID=1008807 RepID=A0AAW2YQ74_9EUKA
MTDVLLPEMNTEEQPEHVNVESESVDVTYNQENNVEEIEVQNEASFLNVSSAPQDRILQLEMYYGESIPSKFITLEITNAFVKKPFIGGFRHKLSQVEYHHASTQTDKPQKEDKDIVKIHRETQTKKFKSRSQQTSREQGTQMAKPGVTLDEQYDRTVYLVPLGKYFDSDQLEALRLRMAIKIQSFMRGWRARTLAKGMHREQLEKRRKEQEKERLAQEEIEENRRTEINRRMHPKTKADFEVMYNELEQWRRQETDKINSTATSQEEKTKRLQELLRRQTKLLQTIDRLKSRASQTNAYDKIHNRLAKMSMPKEIENATYDNKSVYVETPYTIRAKELTELHHGLNTENLSVDERLDVLLHVKWTVKEFDCRLTRDIVDLIDREADLLNRGRKEQYFEGCRKRLSNLFLQFVETPEFNPEALRFVKVPLENTRRDHVQLLSKK